MATFYNNLNSDESSLKLIQDSVAEENIFENNVSCASGVSVNSLGDTAYYFERSKDNILKQKAGGKLAVNNAGVVRKSIDMSYAICFCEEVRKAGFYSVDPVEDRLRYNIKKSIIAYNDEALKYLCENGYSYDDQYTDITAQNAYDSIIDALQLYKEKNSKNGLVANCVIVSNNVGSYLLKDNRFIKLQPTAEEVRKHNHLIGRINDCLVFSADLGLSAWEHHEYVDFIVYNSDMFVAPLDVWNISVQDGTVQGYPNSDIVGGELRYGFAIAGSDDDDSEGVLVHWNTELVDLSWGKASTVGNNIKVYLKKGSGASATYEELSGTSAVIAKGSKIRLEVLRDENEKEYISAFAYKVNDGSPETVTADVPSLVSIYTSDITVNDDTELEVTTVTSIPYYTITITNQADHGFVYDITSTCVTYPSLGFEVTVPAGIETDDLTNAKIILGSDVRFTVKYDASTAAGSFTYALNDDVETEVSGNATLFEFGEHVPSVTDDNVLPFKLLEVTEPVVPPTPSLTPFAVNDVFDQGDYIYFDNSISDSAMLTFLQGLTYDGDGVCNLVQGLADGSTSQDPADKVALLAAVHPAEGVYTLSAYTSTNDNIVWITENSMSITPGWQTLTEDGGLLMSYPDGESYYTVTDVNNNVSGWNGVIAGTKD